MNLEDLERLLRDRLDALGTAPRSELLHVLIRRCGVEPHVPRRGS